MDWTFYVYDTISRFGNSFSFLLTVATVKTSYAWMLEITGDETDVHIDTKCTFSVEGETAWHRFVSTLYCGADCVTYIGVAELG